jgi:hypothetical protein
MKTVLIISFLLYNLFEVVYNIRSSDNDDDDTPQKNIYYNPPFSKFNNITGTGNKFRDDAYRAICMSLNCVSGCCNGDINIMGCGQSEECLEYNDYVKAWRIAIITILSVLILFVAIWCITRVCKQDETCGATILMALAIMGVIIFFPIVLMVMLEQWIVNRSRKHKSENR